MQGEGIRFLDPHVLASIDDLELRARTVVEGFVSGLHKSPFRGFSVEFTEYRHYYPGDDLRHIDWKVFARSDKYYIKQYEEETNLQCHILLDASASMGYGGTGNLTKLEYASFLASALAYFMFRQRDAVGLTIFDEHVRERIPARYRAQHLIRLLREVEAIVPGARTDVAKPLRELAETLRRKGLIVLISDLLDEPDDILTGLQVFRSMGNDVIVFQVLDDDELTFPFDRIAEFEDQETRETLTVVPGAIRKSYLAEVRQFLDMFESGCQRMGIDYCLLNSRQPLDFALATYLAGRGKAQ